jgi:hypothetical protein
MPDKKFELGDYVEVKDRIKVLYEFFPQARIETDYHLTAEPDDRPKVIVRALVYRKPEDEKPAGHGTSWLYLPGSTPYTKGSEIENAETSAVGRAIGMLGILIAGGMASKQEVENKAGEQSRPPRALAAAAAQPYEPVRTHDGGLIGTAKIGNGKADFELRETPEGWAISFRLAQGRQGIKIVAFDGLAEALYAVKGDVLDQRVTCWGTIADEEFTKDGKTITYQVMTLERIQTSEWTLPAESTEAPSVAMFEEPVLPAPPDDVPLVGEAESAPLGLVS